MPSASVMLRVIGGGPAGACGIVGPGATRSRRGPDGRVLPPGRKLPPGGR